MKFYIVSLSFLFFLLHSSATEEDNSSTKSANWIKTELINKNEFCRHIYPSETFNLYKNSLPIIKIHLYKEKEIKRNSKRECFFLIILSSSESSSKHKDKLSIELDANTWTLFLEENRREIKINSLEKIEDIASYTAIFSKNGLRFGELYRISFLLEEEDLNSYCFKLKKNSNEFYFKYHLK